MLWHMPVAYYYIDQENTKPEIIKKYMLWHMPEAYYYIDQNY